MAAPTDWVPILNTTTEVIPAGGLMSVEGVDEDTGAFMVAKPTTDGDTTVCVNGFSLIPAKGTGQGSFDPRTIIAYDPQDGTPGPGETWGSQSGTWLARNKRRGFLTLGGAGLGLVNAVRPGPLPMGFEVETTDWWDPVDGYKWKRLKLTPHDAPTRFGNGTADGKNAVSFVDEVDLLPGTMGMLFPDPDGGFGYIFVHCCSGPTGSSSSSSGSSSSSSSSESSSGSVSRSGSSSSGSSSSGSSSSGSSESQSESQSSSSKSGSRSGSGSGSAGGCVDVVTDVSCDPVFGLEVTNKTLCGTVTVGGVTYQVNFTLS